jgi:transcriptional regulator with XRE-family HTH domain
MTQLSIPVDVSVSEISRQQSLGAAISLCAHVAGFSGKEIQSALKLDKAQWSRWESGGEGVVWEKLCALMGYCGNDVPLLWMLHRLGYDLNSLRKRESETEKRLREATEEIVALRRVLRGQV